VCIECLKASWLPCSRSLLGEVVGHFAAAAAAGGGAASAAAAALPAGTAACLLYVLCRRSELLLCYHQLLLFLLLLLRPFPELLLLGRAYCAQRVQVSVLVLVQGGCLGRWRVGCRPSHFCVLGDRQITSSPLLPPLPRRSGCVCFVCWCCVAAVLGRMRGGVPQTMSMLYLIQQNALRICTSTRTPYSC